jgi:CheY-like chemotaxis protein
MNDPVLYVDDGPDDIFFMQRAFQKVAPEVELKVIKNGQDAADFFDLAQNQNAAPQPLSLVILDLNLPGRSGLEVLAQIRKKFPPPHRAGRLLLRLESPGRYRLLLSRRLQRLRHQAQRPRAAS